MILHCSGITHLRLKAECRSLLHYAFRDIGVHLRRSRRRNSHQLIVARDQIPVLAQIADHHLGRLAYFRAYRECAQLPNQMIRKIARLGEKVLERRPFYLFHLARAAITRIKVFLEERAEIDLFKGVFLLDCSDGVFFGRSTFAIFFAPSSVIQQRNRLFQLFEHWILHHFGRDHVPQLELIERQDTDHLHQARSQDLPLRNLQMQLGL